MHVSTLEHHPCFSDAIFEQALRHEVIFIVLNIVNCPSYQILSRKTENGVHYVHIGVENDFDFTDAPQLESMFLNFVKKIKPDVIHIQLFSGVNALALLRASSFTPVKRIITLHIHTLFCVPGTAYDKGRVCHLKSLDECACETCHSVARTQKISLSHYNRIRESRLKEIISLSDKIICCSHWQKGVLDKISGIDNKTTVLHYGISISRRRALKTTFERTEIESAGISWKRFLGKIKENKLGEQIGNSQTRLFLSKNTSPEKLQQVFGKDLAKIRCLLQTPLKKIQRRHTLPTFGYLGTLWEFKGVDVLLGCVQKLQDLNFQFLMGLKAEETAQKDMTQLNALRQFSQIKIILNYARKDLYEKVFSQIDYLIIPSFWEETGPMTLFESFYYKKPVIIANRPSLIEKTKVGVNSFVFQDPDSLCRLMREIIEGRLSLPAKLRRDFPVQSIKEYTRTLENIYIE